MNDNRVPLRVMALSDEVEEYIRKNILKQPDGNIQAQNNTMNVVLLDEISRKEEWCLSHGFINTPIVCRPDIRLNLRRFIEKRFPRMKVLSYMEITPDYKLDVISVISFKDYTMVHET